MVNIKSTRRPFKFFLPAQYTVMYTCYQRGVCVTVLGCGQFLPFIIKCILGIKPCGFGNKRMRLLNPMYMVTLYEYEKHL